VRRRPQDPRISSAAYQTFAAFAPMEFPELSLNDINTILKFCPSIEELDLGINRASEQHLEILQAISIFPRLRSLTLRTQTLGTELDEPAEGQDLDLGFVETAWKILRTPKKHLPLAKLKVEVSQVVYLTKAERQPENLDWETLEASGHPRLATRTFNVSWQDDSPKELIPK